jgi:anti-sigma regulatory factor (Ser/Thr protein kinase)
MDKRTIKKMEVALEEAVVNVIHYAQAEWIELKIESKDAISIQIADNGIPFDPTAQAPIDISNAVEQRQIGGLGIALIKQIADQVQYRRNNNINELTIIKNL